MAGIKGFCFHITRINQFFESSQFLEPFLLWQALKASRNCEDSKNLVIAMAGVEQEIQKQERHRCRADRALYMMTVIRRLNLTIATLMNL